MNSITNITPQQLRHAADIQERIQSLQTELAAVLGAPAAAEAPRKRHMSAAGRAAIAAAARARWARLRGAKAGAASPGKKRKFTAAGRARLAALARARWAKVKASGKSRL